MSATIDDKSSAAEISSGLWSKAKDNLSKDDQGLIRTFDWKGNSGIVLEILASAKEKQRESLDKQWKHTRKDGTVIVYREYFDKIISSITKFQEAADFLVSLDVSGHAAMPWAGVKFFLSVGLLATKNSEKWGSVLKGMEFIAREISYYGIFEVIYLRRDFRATEQLSDALVRSYTKILKYLCGARRYYEQHSYERLLKSVLSFDEDLEGTVTGIRKDREEIERLRGMIDGQQQEEISDNIKSLSEDQKANHQQLLCMLADLAKPWDVVGTQLSEVKEELREMHAEITAQGKQNLLPKLFEHLKPGKVTDYPQNVMDLTPGTATWILETKSFGDWLDGKKSVLFISGGPGSGKSHLSTRIIDHLLQRVVAGSARPDSVGYYYFHDRDQNTQSALNALCAIVYQMASRDEVYRMHAASACEKSPRYEMATLRTVWYDFIAAEYPRESSPRLFVVLDGIDEADRSELTELLKILSESVHESHKIQVLLLGRPEMDTVIKMQFSRVPYEKVEINNELNREDIRKFSQARYDKLIQVPPNYPALRRKVISTLADKADGMFLWVDLIYKEVLKNIKSPKQLNLAMDILPESGLTSVYDRIFSRIERDNTPAKRLILREIFCWAAFFKQPLSLFYLNQLASLSGPSQVVDVETIIEETCSSLFVLVKTGGLLLEDLDKLEDRTSDDVDEKEHMQSSLHGNESDVEEYDDYADEEYDEGKEMEAIAEADEELQRRQREIYVQLRHASLGDYLKRQDLPSSSILLNSRQGKTEVVLSMIRVIRQGVDAPQELWVHLMTTFLEQLRSLGDADTSEDDTTSVVNCLYDIFASETLGRHVAKFHITPAGYPFLGDSGDCFFFGINSNLQHPNRLVVQKWLRLGLNTVATKLREEVSAWIKRVLENPLALLVPLTNICVNEWLCCKAAPFELYWRFRFAWRCIIAVSRVVPLSGKLRQAFSKRTQADVPQTDLIPPPPPDLTEDKLKDFPYNPNSLSADPYNFLANILDQQRTIEAHLAIAKSASYIGDNEVATAACREAIQMARTQGSTQLLQEIYLQQVKANFDFETMYCSSDAREAMENYLATNPIPNAEILAFQAVVKFNDGDFEGTVQAFQECLELDRSASGVGMNLLLVLLENQDFAGVMKQLEYYGPATTGAWLRAAGDSERILRAILHAARATNKLDLLITIFEYVIQNPGLVDDDSWENADDKARQKDEGTVRRRVINLALSSMFRVYLGWLFYEHLGQSEKAFDLWRLAFFQRSEFLKLPNLVSTAYSDTILYFFGVFSQLILDNTPAEDPEESSRMLSLLENLQARERLFWKMEERGLKDVKITNLPLAKLYLTHGKKEQARKMLDDQFNRAVEVLQDHIDWNDKYAYDALAKLLFLNGQLESAKIAVSLKQFSSSGYSRSQKVPSQENAESTFRELEQAAPEGPQPDGQGLANEFSTARIDEELSSAEEDEERERTGPCACRLICDDDKTLHNTETTYTCMACADFELCEKCYDNLVNQTGKYRLYICNPKHEFIVSPMEGLDKVKGKTMTLNGKDISITGWLEQIRKEWKKGACFM